MGSILNYIAILAVCFFAGTGNFMNAAINTFEKAFPTVSQPTIMMVSTLPCLIAVPVMLLAGRLVGRKVSYRAVIITGTVLIILGGVTPYFIKDSWTLVLICRAVLGIGAGCYGVRNSHIIRSVPSDKLIQFTGYSTVALTVGGTAAGPVVGWLAGKGWNVPFLYDLVPVIILVLVIIGLKEPEKLPEQTLTAEKGIKGEGKLSWRIYFYALTQLLIIGTLYPMCVSGASIYFDAYGLGTPALAGTVMSLFPLFGVIGNLFLKRFMDTFKRFTIPAMGLLVIISALMVFFWHSMASVIIGYTLAGIGYHIIIGVLQVYNGIEAPPEKLAVGSTMILACKSVGIFLSSYFITLCAMIFGFKDRISVENSYVGCMIVYTLLILFTLIKDVSPENKTEG